jgi:hypothetical protein
MRRLVRDYLPQIAARERTLACLAVVERELARGGQRLVTREVLVPADCTDGFLGAYWRSPAAAGTAGTATSLTGPNSTSVTGWW